MTKILHVVTSVDPALGGVAESIVRRGEKLVEMGHQVEVASLDDPNSPAIHQYPLPLHALGPGKTHWCYSPKLVPWLRANSRRFDAVIVDGIWQYHGYATRKALHGSGVPYYVFPHGMLDPWFKRTYPLKHLKKWLFWPWSEYRLLKDARAVLFTCEEERDLARQSFWLYRANAVVVPFGTSSPPTNELELRQNFLACHPYLSGKKILLFLSRIHPKKGCDLLIEAFAKIAHSEPDLVLCIAGPGDEKLIAALKARINQLELGQRIHWLGMLKGPSKWGAIYASNAFILPSHQENFGIAVAEAMGCGIPVLISNKVNIWKEIHAGHAGFIDNDTIDGTQSNISRWISSSDEELQLLSNNARSTFENKFTIQAMASGLICTISKTSSPVR